MTLAKKLNSKINELKGLRHMELSEHGSPIFTFISLVISGVVAYIGASIPPQQIISFINEEQRCLILGTILLFVAFIVYCIMIDRLDTAKAKKAISQIKVGDTFSWGNLGEGIVISIEEPSPFIKAQFANGEIWHIDVFGRAGFRTVD